MKKKNILNKTLKKCTHKQIGDKRCICEGRYLQAYQDDVAHRVITASTSNKIGKQVKQIIKGSKKQTGGQLLPKLRKISKKNKLHIYRLYDPVYKRRLAIR